MIKTSNTEATAKKMYILFVVILFTGLFVSNPADGKRPSAATKRDNMADPVQWQPPAFLTDTGGLGEHVVDAIDVSKLALTLESAIKLIIQTEHWNGYSTIKDQLRIKLAKKQLADAFGAGIPINLPIYDGTIYDYSFVVGIQANIAKYEGEPLIVSLPVELQDSRTIAEALNDTTAVELIDELTKSGELIGTAGGRESKATLDVKASVTRTQKASTNTSVTSSTTISGIKSVRFKMGIEWLINLSIDRKAPKYVSIPTWIISTPTALVATVANSKFPINQKLPAFGIAYIRWPISDCPLRK